jgi:hypothetical protein
MPTIRVQQKGTRHRVSIEVLDEDTHDALRLAIGPALAQRDKLLKAEGRDEWATERDRFIWHLVIRWRRGISYRGLAHGINNSVGRLLLAHVAFQREVEGVRRQLGTREELPSWNYRGDPFALDSARKSLSWLLPPGEIDSLLSTGLRRIENGEPVTSSEPTHNWRPVTATRIRTILRTWKQEYPPGQGWKPS